MKYPQFENIDTGLVDIDKNPIHNGDILIPTGEMPWHGHAPTKNKPRRWVDPMRVFYNNGSFRIEVVGKGKRANRVEYLSTLSIWANGFKICGL